MSLQVITAKDVEQALANTGTIAGLPGNVVWTPSALDILRERGLAKPTGSGAAAAGAAKKFPQAASLPPGVPAVPPEPILFDEEYRWEPGHEPKTPEEFQRFYYSEPIAKLRERMAQIGHKVWKRGYVDGNGGNLTVRVGDNLVLCTPTLRSKGELRADDMCLVDLEGNQKAGTYRRTSEVMTHLAIMKATPKAKACCHAHPPHATAWAVAGIQPPTCMIPEAEVFLGEIGLAEYQTPGTPANAKAVGEVAKDHMAILMINHGVITWGKDIEDAFWKMENTDSYCQTVWITSLLGQPKTITQGQARELIELRGKLGMDDKRSSWKECELCDNSEFRPGAVCRVTAAGAEPAPAAANQLDPEAEKLVQALTERILANAKG